MSLDDRDWYREALREKHSKLNRPVKNHVINPVKAGLVPMLLFWCAVMGLLYMLMTHYLRPKQAVVMSNGDLVIKRSHDGHFYAVGTVNGREAKFMVDTGASLVSVSEQFARKALILGGQPTTFHTANGDSPGRVVEGVGVSVGPVNVTNGRVGVGLRMKDEPRLSISQI